MATCHARDVEWRMRSVILDPDERVSRGLSQLGMSVFSTQDFSKTSDSHTTAMLTRLRRSRRSSSKPCARHGTDTHQLRQRNSQDRSRQSMQSSDHSEFFKIHKAMSLFQKTFNSTSPFLDPLQPCQTQTYPSTTLRLLSRRRAPMITIMHEYRLLSTTHLPRRRQVVLTPRLPRYNPLRPPCLLFLVVFRCSRQKFPHLHPCLAGNRSRCIVHFLRGRAQYRSNRFAWTVELMAWSTNPKKSQTCLGTRLGTPAV